MKKMTVRDIDVSDKSVLVRVDFNVPIDVATGEITDDSRIRAALPTIQYLRENRAKIILLSHLGRPKGRVVDELRLMPVARKLSEILKQPVATVRDCIGPEVETAITVLKGGEVLLLENLRFHAGEEKGDPEFSEALAKPGEVYVNDAFGTSHRAHASIAGITQYLPAVAGFLLEKEINTLGGLLDNPETPFIAIFGGAKVSDKVAILENIMNKVEALLIGGAMSATFLKAKSIKTGKSLVEEESLDIAAGLLEKAENSGIRIQLPVDVLVAGEINNDAKGKVVSIDDVLQNELIVDIGPGTVKIFCDELKKARTVFWNGPMGIEEIPQFANGTNDLARYIAGISATTIIGGGSTAEVIYSLGLDKKITFISTGGGASLEFLGGAELPGVVLLKDK